ncbi:phage baseplate protein [Agrobacterium leguminum]
MASIIAFSSAIGPVPISCVLSERHTSELDITEIPIETGAKITDHAVVMPKRLGLEIANDAATASFNALVAFQESRVPFSLVSGLKVYNNLLIKGIYPDRDATFSTVLRARVDLQEVIIVGTSYAADPDGDNAERGKAGGTKSTKAAAPSPNASKGATTADRASGTVQRGDAGVTTAPAANKSILSNVFGG